MIAVHGNVDDLQTRSKLPETAEVDADGARLAVIHDAGVQIFNPGSPTERRRAPWPSMGAAQVEGGRLAFELIRLG